VANPIGPGTVCIRALKEYVVARLPQGHPLRVVVLSAPDLMQAETFLVRLEDWLVLLTLAS
jgi:hypothetical protein